MEEAIGVHCEEGDLSEGDAGKRLLGFPSRTIPFRSASFSQVDVTSDGKYIQRTPSKPHITLVPVAFSVNQPPIPTEESMLVAEGSGSGIPYLQSNSCPAGHAGECLEGSVRVCEPQYFCQVESAPLEFCSEIENTPNSEPPRTLNFVIGGDDEPLQLQPTLHAEECERGSLLRQSSTQSDSASDEPPPVMCLSDGSCPSPPHPPRSPRSGRGSQSVSSTLRLGSSAEDSSSDSGKPSASSLPMDFPKGTKEEKRKENGSKEEKKKEVVRNFTFGGFYKRPLRGPYGEMLEAEMKKLIPRREDLENLKAKAAPVPGIGHGSPQMTNPKVDGNNLNLILSSLDDINVNLQHSKHVPNCRSRKISSNTPLQNKEKDSWSGVGLHQRTASTPSDIRYSTTATVPPTAHPTTPTERQLEGSARGHILAEILETERSYVEALRTLVKTYMEPLKASDFMDEELIEEIFFQVPRILWHHERLLAAFQKRLLDDMQSIGDVVLEAFRQSSLQECYSLFVQNWKNAKGALKLALSSKPPLVRFLSRAQSEHKGKLSLDALLIMPIQRIPRYELLFKELLKHTQAIHEDHSRLILLLDKLRKFSLHIDCASVDPGSKREIEIDGWPAGLAKVIREEILPLALGNASSRKDRAVFLLPDTLLIASIKRKGNRKNQSMSNSAGCKFKLILKATLAHVTVMHEDIEMGTMERGKGRGHVEGDDFRTLQRIMDLAQSLKCPHAGLDTVLHEMITVSTRNNSAEASLELQIRGLETSEGTEWVKLFFGSIERRNSWLKTFNETLDKHMRWGIGRSADIEFYQAVPIRKTRAGLVLSCAAPVSLQGQTRQSDVWVANSDGYVGQICILNLSPEPPSITSCNGVCNSRITCMAPVPPPEFGLGKSSPPTISQKPGTFDPTIVKPIPDESVGWSVWLGTEDGGLHIYDCTDNSVRVKKNRYRVQHKAQLNAITFFQARVFVALGNGDVVVYSRNENQPGWATTEPSWVTIGTPMAPVASMLCVGSNLWCASGSAIKVYQNNGGMLELLQCIHVSGENEENRSITTMVTTEDWVWVAIQGSTVLIAYDANTFQMIHQVNVATHVTKILCTSCDDIIRQHKTACLRITALFVSAGQMLWIGTSGGVILTLCPANSTEAKVTALPQGHTGQVRFLTACLNSDTWTVISGGDGHEEFRQTVSSPTTYPTSFAAMVTSLMGDSGGDPSGREDSTNHLLIWKINSHSARH